MSSCPRRSKTNILNILHGFAKLAKNFIKSHEKYPHVNTQDIHDRSSVDLPILIEGIRRIESGEEPNKVLHETLKDLQ